MFSCSFDGEGWKLGGRKGGRYKIWVGEDLWVWVRVYGSMFVYMSVCVSVFDVARGVYRCVQVCIGMYRYVSVSDVARGVVNGRI